VGTLSSQLGMPPEASSLSDLYLEAVQWCEEMFRPGC
jgi:hypothetical protein